MLLAPHCVQLMFTGTAVILANIFVTFSLASERGGKIIDTQK